MNANYKSETCIKLKDYHVGTFTNYHEYSLYIEHASRHNKLRNVKEYKGKNIQVYNSLFSISYQYHK